MRKPLRINTFILFSLSFLFLLTPEINWSQVQLGRPFITNYSYQDYDAAAINWWAIEGDDGIMYFANGAGVLQYDGVTWNMIDVRGTGAVRCFAKDEQGVIYIGGIGDMGYLEANSTGQMEFVSLLDKIPEEHREFSDVWEVDYYKGKIVFRTEFKLYHWDGQTMQMTLSDDAFHVGKIVHDKYYLRIWGRGLCVME